MSAFARALKQRTPKKRGDRRFVFVAYDQLNDAIGPLATLRPEEAGIVVVENPQKAARRPYHRQKLLAVLSNLRHFALEQAERGVYVEHIVARGPYRGALDDAVKRLGPLQMMEPAEQELRDDLRELIEQGQLEVHPHDGFLTTAEDFDRSQLKPPYRMDRFYRAARKKTGALMQGGKPVGGRWSYDAENRQKWKGDPVPSALPTFEPDDITQEVVALFEGQFARHPGKLDPLHLPASRQDAEASWRWAKQNALPLFGPFEDAMSERSRNLFHSRVSMLVNLSRLLPRRLIEEVEALNIPLPSKEGFIRQLLGWREFMRHVHRRTNGFRDMPKAQRDEKAPLDGGYAKWKGSAWLSSHDDALEAPAKPSLLGATEDLPALYWGQPSGMNCVDHVIRSVWDEGYSHHITRLMVLSNLASLLDVSPRQLTDWFWVAYVDAYDWVVEPNVLAMGTYAVGDLVVTKPYVASANYINKMSDFCRSCRFDPKKNCPFTRLYWAFLERHRRHFDGNPRMIQTLRLLERRTPEQKRLDAQTVTRVQRALQNGQELHPEVASTPTRRR